MHITLGSAPTPRQSWHAAMLAFIATTVCLGTVLRPCDGHAMPGARPLPPGEPTRLQTRALESAAAVVQPHAPVAALNTYLNGFHPMKADPSHQMEAHHYCHQLNEDLAQCVLFDGSDRDARLSGIEYIISEKLYARLPEQERRYWHPHNGEILSGQLVAPGIPEVAERALMKTKINSYGKTWHVWHTGAQGRHGDALPLGEPKLGWSFNREGEAMPGLVEARDERLRLRSAEKRQSRAPLLEQARPQTGVDALKGAFGRPTREWPGVTEARPGP
ncbi:MAG: OBAP family protein [Aquabacterium sp.]